MNSNNRPGLGAALFVLIAFLVGGYFTFAAVQGDYGLFQRAEIEAQEDVLAARLAVLQAQVNEMENLTKRLSDTYLDLDLLDQQARDLLGMIRADEIVIR
ncbi:MAG: septum formation initiator family protein [Pseudomonadota bacterium]